MGFDWDASGVVRTVPSPDTFNRRAARLLPEGAGYRMGYDRSERRNMALGGFLLRYLDGLVPVQLAPPSFYREVLARAGEVTAGELGFHFTSFAHDLSVHALNYQVMPASLREAIRARVRRVAARARGVVGRSPRRRGQLTLTAFFDNDVNRFCYAVWTASDAVDEALRMADDARTRSSSPASTTASRRPSRARGMSPAATPTTCTPSTRGPSPWRAADPAPAASLSVRAILPAAHASRLRCSASRRCL